jgi:hypothetical protein
MNRPEHSPDREAAKVRKIIDHTQLHQITERLFARLPIHIVENNQKNAVRALSYSHPHLEIFHQLPPGPSRTLLLVKDDHSMMLECSVVSRSERGTEFVKPLRLFLSKRGIRHENRVAVSGSELAGQVRNVIPHPEFYRVNAMSNPARDQLFSQYTTALRGLIPETVVKIELQKTNRLLVRQLVRRLERDLDQKRCFPENPITGKILDISHSGIGFLYTGQRNILSSAGVADKIVFDAHFSVENIATFSGRIMNMTSLENGRRYGIEFEHVSASGQKALRQMLEGDS